MSIAFEHDRLSQLLFARDDQALLADVRLRLDGMAIVLTIDADAALTTWGQAAAMAVAACGMRMFRGGIYLRSVPVIAATIGGCTGQLLQRALEALGARQAGEPPAQAMRVHIGINGGASDLQVAASGWTSIVSPKPFKETLVTSNAIAGMLAGAIAVSECFRRLALGAADAGRIVQQVNAWEPGSNVIQEGTIQRLPSALWILGCGNLGQATLFSLPLLPFTDRAAVKIFLQDFDRSGPENLSTQLLTTYKWIGHRKAAAAAHYLTSFGFDAFSIERRFANGHGPLADEPRVALVGVDNPLARRAAASAGFDLVIDAGLGGTPAEIFDLSLYAFPGMRDAKAIWDPAKDAGVGRALPERYKRLVRDGVIDTCGATTIAGQQVGVPSTALAAAAIQIAQLCRALATGNYCDNVDLRTARTGDAQASVFESGVVLPVQTASPV